MTGYKKTGYHDPVLLQEVLESIPDDCTTFMDGTLGHGGHSQAVLEKFCESDLSVPHSASRDLSGSSRGSVKNFTLVGVDRDPEMMTKAQERLSDFINVKYVHSSYADLEKVSTESGIQQFDYILLDIGVNMDHFKVAERGFSLKLDGPLDMRFDQTQGTPVSQRLQQTNYNAMIELLENETDFGESLRDRLSKDLPIAAKKGNFTTTGQLRNWLKDQHLSDKVAVVLFQALRIKANNELKELDIFLQLFVSYLSPGGICGIMTYHSGEDRRVKNAFKTLTLDGHIELINKKVIKPTRQEVKKNKAARSAKWRMVRRVKRIK